MLGVGKVAGQEEDCSDLGKLRRLDAEAPYADPSPGPIHQAPEEAGIEEEAQDDDVQVQADVPETPVVREGQEQGYHEPRRPPDDLPHVLAGHGEAVCGDA